jgi:hypothetical protein
MRETVQPRPSQNGQGLLNLEYPFEVPITLDKEKEKTLREICGRG